MRQFERRTAMAERQGEHRMKQEDRVIRNNILMERLGWLSATLLGFGGLLASLYLVYIGRSAGGIAGIVSSLAALVGLFVYARRDQVQEVAKKRAREMIAQGEPIDEQLDLLPHGPSDDKER